MFIIIYYHYHYFHHIIIIIIIIREVNESKLQAIENKYQEAIQTAGDMEVLDALFSKATHFAKTGSWDASIVIYDEILNKPKTSTGKKIDAMMSKARIAIYRMDIPTLNTLITEAKRLIEIGGDWDRRNRLKVYEALYLMSVRDVRAASILFLECIATFTCVELCSYKQFVYYALLTSIMSLSRNDLKKKIVDNPHVISVIRDTPSMQNLLNSIYNCEYSQFFSALMVVQDEVVLNRHVGPHSQYLVREYRILAYSQFLEAYKSVMLSSMATAFDVPLILLDEELSKFIAAGRLNAKIDKVGDIVETSRPDKKNSKYQEVIKKGDTLLNHIQKLVRVIDMK
jgi:26S proteasome regulatory subunit N7